MRPDADVTTATISNSSITGNHAGKGGGMELAAIRDPQQRHHQQQFVGGPGGSTQRSSSAPAARSATAPSPETRPPTTPAASTQSISSSTTPLTITGSTSTTTTPARRRRHLRYEQRRRAARSHQRHHFRQHRLGQRRRHRPLWQRHRRLLNFATIDGNAAAGVGGVFVRLAGEHRCPQLHHRRQSCQRRRGPRHQRRLHFARAQLHRCGGRHSAGFPLTAFWAIRWAPPPTRKTRCWDRRRTTAAPP